MQVNISHRLIKSMIQKGNCFLSENMFVVDLPKALYAIKPFNVGETIRILEGKLVLQPTRESIHIGNGQHVIDKYGKFINHSFKPNTKIELNNVIAIQNIEKYDEITFNYNESEINMACPFEIDGVDVCGKLN